MSDRLKFAKLLKQFTWNKPNFSEGYLVTKMNLDKKDSNSFYYKDEDCDIYFEWLTAIRPGVLLSKLVNPVEFISPAVVEKINNQWKLNKEETDKAVNLLQENSLVSIHVSKEENEPIYLLSEALCDKKIFLEGQLLIPKDWPNTLPDLKGHLNELIENGSFSGLEEASPEKAKVINNYFGEVELASPRTVKKNSLKWENLTYSFSEESTSNSGSKFTKRTVTPKEKLVTLLELLDSEEMNQLVSKLKDKKLTLNSKQQFNLALELVLGFNSMVILDEE